MERAVGLITANYSVRHPSVLTKDRPPASMPVAGRFRMVDFALSSMSNSGMRDVGLITPSNYRSLIDHVESGKAWSLDRKHGGLFMLPGSSFGTQRSGARFLVRDIILNEQFLERATKPYVILSAASIIINMDLVDLVDAHIKSGADVTMVCQKAQEANTSLVCFERAEDGRMASNHLGVKAGELASLDLCVMTVDVLKQLIDWYRSVDYLDLFEALIPDLSRVNVQPYLYDGVALPIFSSDAYYASSMRLLDPKITGQIFNRNRPIHTKSHDNPPAKYMPGAKVKNTICAGGVRIAGEVEGSILGRDVIVEEGAKVKNSIIMQSCVIEAGAKVENAIIDRDNVVARKVELKGTPEDILIKGRGF